MGGSGTAAVMCGKERECRPFASPSMAYRRLRRHGACRLVLVPTTISRKSMDRAGRAAIGLSH